MIALEIISNAPYNPLINEMLSYWIMNLAIILLGDKRKTIDKVWLYEAIL